MKKLVYSTALLSLAMFITFSAFAATGKTEYFRQIAVDGSFDIVGRYSISESDGKKGAAYRFSYGDKGLEQVDFLINGQPKENDFYFGAGIIKIEHLQDGSEKRSYYNYKGKPTRDIVSGAYSVRITRNEENNTISLFNYNKTGSLIKDKYGVAHYLCYLDDEGRRTSSIRFDVTGNRVYDKEGFYELKTIYDDNGNVVEQRNYGPNGRLVDDNVYFASVKRVYDDNGNPVKETYHGVDGELKLHSLAGVAIIKRDFDDIGRLTEERYYGIDGTYRERVKYSGFSYALIRFKYGSNGELKKIAYFDKNERKL